MTFQDTLRFYQGEIERGLEHWIPAGPAVSDNLNDAMRYAVLGTGKRIRPALVYATGTALGARIEQLEAPAVAIEMIHAYSLVHDDLPAMDDDDMRRGRPTCHKAFDEATAILAGDGLQALAFSVLARDRLLAVSDSTRIEMIATLAFASGAHGMVGGQAIDLAAANRHLSLPELENMHIHKTGALIEASIVLGILASGCTDATIRGPLSRYGRCIGLAFQVQDDILDVIGETQMIGKPRGSDIAKNKSTYPELLGLEGAKQIAENLHADAVSALDDLPFTVPFLEELAVYIVNRSK